MKNILSSTAALFLVLGVFFVAAPSAHAASLSFPQQFSYAGLTFIQPLTYNKQAHLKPATLTFGIPDKLSVASTTQGTEKVDSEAELLPTIAMTLPVLPSQTPPVFQEAQKKQIQTPTPTTPNESTENTQTIVVSTQDVTDTPPPPTPTPTTAPLSTPASTVSTPANPGGLNADVLFSMVNNYRQGQGLPTFQKDDKTCALAASRAPEVNGEVASGTMHSGLRARNLPYWNTENIISMNSEAAAFNWWINDKIHHDAIVGNYKYSCLACSGNACAEEFTNYQPK